MLPREEFLSVGSGNGEGDDGAVDAALAHEGVLGAEGEVRPHHLVADELAVSGTQTWKSRNYTEIQKISPLHILSRLQRRIPVKTVSIFVKIDELL